MKIASHFSFRHARSCPFHRPQPDPGLPAFPCSGGALSSLVRPDHLVPVCERPDFGVEYEADSLDFAPPGGRPNTWRCELTGQQWLDDSAPVRSPAPLPAPPAPTPKTGTAPLVKSAGGASVKPLRQRNGSSCGQTSVAMGINALTGKRLTDADIHRRYGFSLLSALNSECRGSGYRWVDGGDFRRKDWPCLEKRLNQERTPVLIGLNGPSFSPSGRGHIVTLLSIEGEKVRYADPADGKVKITTRRAIEQAPPHPDGKFFFYATPH